MNTRFRKYEGLSSLIALTGASGLDPDTIRGNILSHLCGLFNASAAFLVFAKDGKPNMLQSGRVTDPANYSTALEKLSSTADPIVRDQKLCVVRLSHDDEPLGAIGFRFEKKINGSLPESFLTSVAGVVSLFEHQRKLTGTVEASSKSLRILAGDSVQIANNNARLFRELTANLERMQSISKGVIRMQEEERSKISRELHDDVGQALTALKMNLDLVATRLQKEITGESRQYLEEAAKLAEQCLGEIRELSRLLRPRMLDDLGLLPTLRWYARTYAKRTGIKVSLLTEEFRAKVGSEVETMLFRITQEALNNIAKHSGSKTAQIRLVRLKEKIRLNVQDEGKGFDPADSKNATRVYSTSGLSGIQDRVNLWGGSFSIQSKAGAGTILSIEIPFKESRRKARKKSR